MRSIRLFVPFSPPGISNGERPASSVYTVAPSWYTSLRWSLRGGSRNASGGDHGTDTP